MNPYKGLREIPRNIWLVSAASLINRTGMMVLPFLAIYLTQELKVSAAEAGLVLTFYGVGALISAPFAGKLSDRIGSMKLMKISLLLSGVCLFIYSFTTNYHLIIIISIILAIISEAFRPASMAFIADEAPKEQRKQSFSLYRLAINLGMSFGPVLGGVLTSIDFSLLFYVDGITSILAAIYLIFAKWEPLRIHKKNAEDKIDKEALPPYRDHRLVYLLIALSPVIIVFFQHFSTMPLFIVDYLGFSRITFGFLVSINTILIIFIEVPLNVAMQKVPEWKSLSLGGLLCGIGFGGMAIASDISGIIVTIIIWTFGEMLFFPSVSALAGEISPENKRGEYMGYLQMMHSFCFIGAPLIGTYVYQYYGSQVLWIGTFFLGLITTVMMLRIKRWETISQ